MGGLGVSLTSEPGRFSRSKALQSVDLLIDTLKLTLFQQTVLSLCSMGDLFVQSHSSVRIAGLRIVGVVRPVDLFELVALLPSAAPSSVTRLDSSGSTMFGGLPADIVWDIDAPALLLLRFDCP